MVAGHEFEARARLQTQKRSHNKEMAPRVSVTGRSVQSEAYSGVPTDHEARRQERSS